MIFSRQKLFDYLHLCVLASLAFAQPVYDMLGRYPGFLVAHRAGSSVILLMVVAVTLVIPLFLVLAEVSSGIIFGQKVRRILHYGMAGILAGIVILPPLNRWGALPDAAVYLIALITAGGFIFFYSKWKIARNFLTAMSPAILVFPAYFLFFTPVRSVVIHKDAFRSSGIEITNKVPVVLIVFDEFNTMALLNKDGVIDSARYPNFAALAGESWWFPNATCASLETLQSIPAMLTGKNPSAADPKLATFADHPFNLFSLLAGRYYFNVHETETSLCPDQLKKYARKFEPSLFISDISMLFRVLIIPGLMKNSEDYFGGRWTGFNTSDAIKGKSDSWGIIHRKKQIKRFVEGILPDKPNQLDFMHLELPHVPYEFLSTGKSYNNTRIFPDGIASEEAGWGNSPELVEVAYQRYLQQVGYTDRVLGEIIDGLKKKNIFNEAVIIITADHGVSMQPGKSRRSYFRGNEHEIFKVPLILKLPDQKKPEVSVAPAGGIDILPTIAGILGIKVPWSYDGGSMISGRNGEPVPAGSDKVNIAGIGEFNAEAIEGFPLLGWQTSVFGSGTPLTQLVRRDSNYFLVGKSIKDLDIRSGNRTYTMEIDEIDQFRNIDLRSGYLPALMRGHVLNIKETRKLALAVALNGRIRATASASSWNGENAFFTALLPEAAFQQGINNPEIFLIRSEPKSMNLFLERISIENMDIIFLRRDKAGKESLVHQDGREIPVKNAGVTGFLDNFRPNDRIVSITGWAFDDNEGSPAGSVVIFLDDEYLVRAKTGVVRKDLVSYLKTEKAKLSGFHVMVPVPDHAGKKIRAFGLAKNGSAVELKITGNAKDVMKKFFKR